MDKQTTKVNEQRMHNSGFKKLVVQWLKEVQSFNGTFLILALTRNIMRN
jgi:hypothetical protein